MSVEREGYYSMLRYISPPRFDGVTLLYPFEEDAVGATVLSCMRWGRVFERESTLLLERDSDEDERIELLSSSS